MAGSPSADSAAAAAGVSRPADYVSDSIPDFAISPGTSEAPRDVWATSLGRPATAAGVITASGADTPAPAVADSAPLVVPIGELDAVSPSPSSALVSSGALEEGECVELKTRGLRRDTAPAIQALQSSAPARMASVVSNSTIRVPLFGLAAGPRFPGAKAFESAVELAEFFQDLSPSSPSTHRVQAVPSTPSDSAAASPY
ncbi:uncharacterized protein IUM83_08689 [Phytophthora cinnamomi]|uniref:uncharacterized protein n=1 Tax=Phytophthora cinnamomi TaxID=4785 RepID=UPI0035594FC7|nr:hypothetical protein IUM83_08689 [Phytophthora cinnamomi]